MSNEVWTLIASVLGGVILVGGAWKAAPSVGQFLLAIPRGIVAAAKVPLTIQAIAHEFAPNSGESMRDKINVLIDDTAHLRETTHRIDGKLAATIKTQVDLIATVHQHATDDIVSFGDSHEAQMQIKETQEVILQRLVRIEDGVQESKVTADQVKHDLGQYNEIDKLGREGRIDRRSELAAQTADLQRQLARIEAEQASVAADLAAMQARADAVTDGAPGEAADAGMQSDPDKEKP